MNWLPIALLAVPLAGSAVLLAPLPVDAPARGRLLRLHGLAVSGITFLLAVVLAAGFDHADPARVQFTTDLAWIPGLDLRFHLGVDGISLPLVVLTTLLTFLCFVYLCWGRSDGPGQLLRPRPGGNRPRALVFTLLVLEVGMIGTFLALDLLLFFVFFEIVLIPMYFVIAVWGGRARRAAATKFILYTLLGSVALLVGLLLVWAQTGTLDMVALGGAQGTGMSRAVQIIAFLAIGIGLAVKTPMWPLHTWLPDAHTEAPTVGSVLLAGVLLKMGTYGFARIAIPVLPDGAAAVAPWLGALAVVGIVYGSLACLAQRDLKRMIAYSSIGHMGFVLLGFATLTPVGVNAALFGNIAHGLITGLLFFVAGAVKERYGTADMPTLGGGMLVRLPHLGSVLTFACVASLGLPGLAGFWGEMLALLGAFDPAPGLSRPLFLTFMAVGGLGTVLTAAYFLVMLSRVTHGRPTETVHAPLLAGVKAGVSPGDTAAEAVAGPGDTAAEAVTRPGEAVPESAGRVSADAVDTGTASVRTGGRAGPGGGGTGPGGGGGLRDVRAYEVAAWAPLVGLILLFGLWPKALLLITDPVVRTFVGAP
ncbi:NADH-quinone oxidoreductase subunit M [Planomonospora parontospora subsp. parontospora]|uniref:NADH-quinone oxidoreductase subunit M n=2 Tax=Planomonospora parontospora TaxID=58119 RepID=A0AA37BDR2_9ACTN|nr:NADH-quinone oxidoreductase subunit M [Planomonospora parontospora]GGK53199.1 NADH-quinone oxidoreductase subunit M [Planomonospora parontospora]GII07668.1 NADH-quinone oxidoreductase subunit M [Planomonospora parontospora subsp. parontospora]